MLSIHLGLLAAASLQGEGVIPSWTSWGTCASEPAFADRNLFAFPQELEVAKFEGVGFTEGPRQGLREELRAPGKRELRDLEGDGAASVKAS